MNKNIIHRFVCLICATLFSLCGYAQFRQLECEDTCKHIHGIDISHHQGDMAWYAAGMDKMAYCYIKATEGGNWVDPNYERYLRACRERGIKVGSYHFYRPKTDQQKQVENFLVQCNPQTQDLLPMIDIEHAKGIEVKEFQDSLKKFLKLFRKVYRVKPLIYTGTNFYNKYLVKQLKGYPLMIAQYNSREPRLADKHKILMWQYTGSGKIRGLRGVIDKSRFLKKYKLKKIRWKH